MNAKEYINTLNEEEMKGAMLKVADFLKDTCPSNDFCDGFKCKRKECDDKDGCCIIEFFVWKHKENR